MEDTDKARARICAVVAADTVEEMVDRAMEAREDADLVEFRIDHLVSLEQLEGLKEFTALPVILTLRSAIQGGRSELEGDARRAVLERIINLGPAYIDLEFGNADMELIAVAKCAGVGTILSFHDFEGTPEGIADVAQVMAATDADIIKLVTTAGSWRDELTMLTIDQRYTDRGIVAFCMGELGVLSRVLCPLIGGRFTYAFAGRSTANGQISLIDLRITYNTVQIHYE
ncbi:MAG: type I 3-dehydroquinate dehydratase [Candidatus Undinarchaeales archaeon]|nr:type I 3-dehydroquinate dehydratase [Candidatus Undinarchaeales archaeon]MDP7493529.1 type I 3-dehydroquinate dehydratase [Candidatus Undinarchaeales archaeon]